MGAERRKPDGGRATASEPPPQPALLEVDLPPVPEPARRAHRHRGRRLRVEVALGVGGHPVAHLDDAGADAVEALRAAAPGDLRGDVLGHHLALAVGEDPSLMTVSASSTLRGRGCVTPQHLSRSAPGTPNISPATPTR